MRRWHSNTTRSRHTDTSGTYPVFSIYITYSICGISFLFHFANRHASIPTILLPVHLISHVRWSISVSSLSNNTGVGKGGRAPSLFFKGGLAPAPSFLHSRFCISYCVVTVVTDNFILKYWYWHYYNIIFWNQHSFCSRSVIQSQSFRHRPDQ